MKAMVLKGCAPVEKAPLDWSDWPDPQPVPLARLAKGGRWRLREYT